MTQAITVSHVTSTITPEMVKKYLCPTATDAEIFLFMKLCESQSLNPWVRDAYLVKYRVDQPAAMIIGKDGFTRRAEDHPKFAGFKAGIIVDSEQHGEMEREGAFYAAGETIIGGWAEVHRNDRAVPLRAKVRLEEYNTKQNQWNKMPGTMIRKVALVQALREAFPSSFAGLYDAAEMGVDADTLPNNVIDSTAVEVPPALEKPPTTGGITRAQRDRIAELVELVGWSREQAAVVIQERYNAATLADLSRDQVFDFMDWLETQAARQQPASAEV